MANSYKLQNPVDRSRDYIASGELGPMLHVSNYRIRRDLKLGGRLAGSIYAQAAEPIGPGCERLLPVAGSVTFELAPYERNHQNQDFMAWAPSGPFCADAGDRNDYALWNLAAQALQQASDRLTIHFNRERHHWQKGRWTVSYVGSSGVDSVAPLRKTISAGSIHHSTAHAVHFLAVATDGATYRIKTAWEPASDSMGQCFELTLGAIHLGGPTAKLPLYLKNWIFSRLA